MTDAPPGYATGSAIPQPSPEVRARREWPRATAAARRSPGEVRITVRLEFFGDGLRKGEAGDRRLERWVRGAERRWNRTPPVVRIEDGRLRVARLRFAFEWRRRDAASPPAPGFHQVEVVSQLAELRAWRRTGRSRLMDGWRSWTWLGGRAGRAACYGSLIWPTVVAHEIGHLFGLKDEYDRPRSRWEVVRSTVSGRRRSLMDLSWAPWARVEGEHADRIFVNATRYRWWEG